MSAADEKTVPLCVDLDGTLLRTDLAWECLFAALRHAPLALLSSFGTLLLRGRAAFKRALALAAAPDLDVLPWNPQLLDALRRQRAAGRRMILCTAATQALAERIASKAGFFDEVLASSQTLNLSGSRKAHALVERFGRQGFDYAGNSRADLPVWREARSAWVVNAAPAVLKSARRLVTVEQVLDAPQPRFGALIKALRLHQAVKNLLVFVPVLAAHAWTDRPALIAACTAFLAFSLLAPATYLLNDALDLGADRRHPRKCRRPFASGALPLSAAAALIPLLTGLSLVLALSLPGRFQLLLLSYLIVTLAYSFRLKQTVLLDALILAALYVLRILAGSAATGITASFWLLAFSMFLFQSLALAKRYTELKLMLVSNRQRAAGRGYQTEDLPLLEIFGASSGQLSVLVLALYINDESADRLYSHPHLLWGLCPVLLWWLGRVWILTHRGAMHDDPVVFALKDRLSLFGFLVCAILLMGAR